MVETRSGKMQDTSEERLKTEESAKPQPSATIGRDASADPVGLNPNIDIPKYDGTEDPRPWIESLEEIGFLYHWAEYIISRYAAMNMIGSAKTWLDLHKISFTSWEHFKSRLIQDFGSDANKEELKMRLNRMQQWNEPAIRFAEDILVLCNKVDPQMEEENKINWVIGGLKKEYSFALYLNPPKNTNELLRLCKKMDLFENNYQERIEKSKALYNGPRSPRSHHQEQWKNAPSFRRPDQNTSKPQAPAPRYYQNTPKPQAPAPRYYQNKPLPQVSAPRRFYTPIHEPKPVYPRKTYNKSPDSNRNRTEDGRPICFKCNKPGHVARYCRVKFVRIVEEDPSVSQDKSQENLQMDERKDYTRPRLYADVLKDVYPIPRIDDVMDTLQGSKYFSAIDLKSGYWQVEIEERDKEKTAFTTAHGLYEFNVMPFGLCNAPATFERNMDNVLGNLRWQICLCYLDDVIIYSSDFQTHIKRLEAVLRCFSESNLKLNAKKCRFAFEELEILGHITNQEGIKPAEYNIKAVRDFPQPKKAKEVQSFLGMCSYYRKFIKDFSLIADPLTSLIRKNVQFIWTGKQEEAFQNLKKALMNPPILGHFDPNAATCIHTDASNIGLGATLIQNIGGEEKLPNKMPNLPHKIPPEISPPVNEPQSTVSYAKKIFSESTVSGISHIAQADNYCRKLLWFCLFSFCLAGFLYQMGTFLMWYWAYPTQVDVQIVNKGRLTFPSVTVCNGNRQHPRMTAKQVSEFQKEMLKKRIPKDDRQRIGHELKEIVLFCQFTGVPALYGENCTSRFEYFYDPGFGNCYSFITSHTSEPELIALESDVWQTRSFLSLVLNAEADEYMDTEVSPSLWITLHVGEIVPDTYSDNTQIDPGYSYTLSASKPGLHRLVGRSDVRLSWHRLVGSSTRPGGKSPRLLLATDVTRLCPPPHRNAVFGACHMAAGVHPSTGCTAACAQTLQFKECHYVVDHLSTFYDELPWNPNKETESMIREKDCAKRVDVWSKDYCRSLCRVPCFDSYFDTSVESFDWPPESDYPKMEILGQWASRSLEEIKISVREEAALALAVGQDIDLASWSAERPLAEQLTHGLARVGQLRTWWLPEAQWKQVKIFMPSMDHRIYIHVPKYMTLELFSYLGGYVGIWLGISLVAICELIEKIFMILTYRCRSSKTPQVQPAPWRTDPPSSHPSGPWDYNPGVGNNFRITESNNSLQVRHTSSGHRFHRVYVKLGHFLIGYYSFPTQVEVIVYNNGSLEFPSVTICNSNSAFIGGFSSRGDFSLDLSKNSQDVIKVELGAKDGDRRVLTDYMVDEEDLGYNRRELTQMVK
ncbi:K02A2.6-like [Cordylochernes scorpioides]|uniref:K02A2.6-like n=1 Tax=Cordylochernes scorpioides TaxID=51811 RepID=A0ABY6KCP7_9ARAC|nr:K02A2.6-like [Cordylochernes scorpioides]